MSSTISVIIPAYNAESTIGGWMEAIFKNCIIGAKKFKMEEDVFD